ncbi:hypothetical protein N474_05200 [Pseudoalteromonas luteoviolacea CPMOR-2]|uniref:Uncharacterized protein n=1 Tax=Pseudoalteromonas luteoviolacea DSM 6061 TaxID=1365250 RepID=A0A166WLL7_9GAMM|nr:hypothetical protein [Pseudoalteromonas luteoviolacea]KZN37625.1 hypothetical protein N475_02110 [Pseudoalteromonas luteoviolacea DSM 6061]KZN49651.1 hypothetical protein N474_05200 [Pseudoalteromonas luteoviolacea CPMOR-2]MBE0386952.1 hypothetical protein [Pseudoalteromonas luteoviolacea DSM 6061]
MKYKEQAIWIGALVLFFSIYSKSAAFTWTTLPESRAVEQPESLDRTYILKMSGVRDEALAYKWAKTIKQVFSSSQGRNTLVATKCLTPLVRVVKKLGPNAGLQPWFVVEIAIGKTKREMAQVQGLLKDRLTDNPQSFILLASKQDLEGVEVGCQRR